MLIRLAVLSVAIVTCLAQTNTASINGAITDTQDAVVTDTDVVAANDATGVRTAVRTNTSGFYSIPNLPIGTYSLTVQKGGFRRYVRSGIVLTAGQILELNARLEVGAINETMDVTGAEPLLGASTSDVTQVIDSKSIEDLPLGNRRTMNVIQMTGAAIFVSNDTSPVFALAGGRLRSQMTWMDGGNAQNIRIGVGFQVSDPPVDTIQEIKVLANSYRAEYGGSAGGVIIQTTKSGTNQPHGSAYEYLRNDAMDAPGFFALLQNGAKVNPELRYNVFGGTAGGPIRRNRTFFFAGYEGTRRRTENVVTGLTFPTELQRAGDFSKKFDLNGRLIPIYDPATSPRQPFPDNIIPQNRLDPVALNLMKYYPHPNRPADTIAGGNNFSANAVNGLNGDFLIGKIDHSLTDRNKLTGRYIVYRSNFDPLRIFDLPDNGAIPGAFGLDHAQSAYASWTHIRSSAVVNDLRYTYINRASHSISAGLGGRYPEKIGLRGVEQNAFPRFAPDDFTGIGSDMQERRQYPVEQHQFVDNVSWLKNRHVLKLGFEARRSRNYDVNLPTASGSFTFTARSTGLPAATERTGSGLASLLLGLPTSFSQMVTQALDRHSWYFSGFAQNEWTAGKSLTLHIGLRWEMDTPMIDSNRRMNGFDPTEFNPVSASPGVVKFAGVNGFPEYAHQFDWNNFSPRFGFAWKPFGSRNTAVRGGYGIFFAHPFDSSYVTSTSLGFSLSATITSLDNGVTAPFVLRDGVPAFLATSPELNDAFGAVRPGQIPRTAVTYFPRDRVSGYSHQFNLTLQRQVHGSILIETAFLGNLGRKLASAALSINQIPPHILGPEHYFQTDRPFPQFSDVSLLAPAIGITNYYAGLFKVEKRLSSGFNLVSTYTWSKLLGNTNDISSGGTFGVSSGPYSNYYNRRADYGPMENDIEHRFTWTSIYELPFGKGRRWAKGGLPDYLLGGWAISALTTIQSGAPATAITQDDSSSAYPAGRQRPNARSNPNLSSTERSLIRWFDTDAFSQPATYTFGNEGIGIIRACGLINSDFSLLRNFPMTEHARLQFRGDFFNAFNHTNFNPPAVMFGSSTFGVVSSAKSARQVQVGARLVF